MIELSYDRKRGEEKKKEEPNEQKKEKEEEEEEEDEQQQQQQQLEGAWNWNCSTLAFEAFPRPFVDLVSKCL